MRPKINTSYRSHGKWGDFLACIVPIIWCLNILTNSSFILRLMEWQNESSLFTIRIRGRQWYWVYKFELRHVIDIISAPKNIGTNQWAISTGGSLEVSDNYFFALRLRSQNVWLKNYWESNVKNFVKYNNSHTDVFLDSVDFDGRKLTKVNSLLRRLANPADQFRSDIFITNSFYDYYTPSAVENAPHFEVFIEPADSSNSEDLLKQSEQPVVLDKKLFLSSKKFKEAAARASRFFLKKFSFCKIKFVNFSKKKFDVFEDSRFQKKINISRQPILVSKAVFELEKLPAAVSKEINVVNVFFNKEKSFVKKIPNEQTFLVLKQKRYKRKKILPQRARLFKNEVDLAADKIKFADRPCFVSTNFLESLNFEPTKLYRAMKKNKVRHEDMPVQLSRRLLRTKKTLVLPAHVNVTVVTNSYDVVHSWFIPALGVKLDCVPGRSTHHVLYCDNIGFYYGQCAEICGRYHHHMPIRMCVLPFEHFVIWWQHFGLSKLLFSFSKRRFEAKFANKTFSW